MDLGNYVNKDALVHERILAKVMNGKPENIDISDHILEHFKERFNDKSLEMTSKQFVDNPYAYRTIADVADLNNLTEQRVANPYLFW